jgi:hypothetical protein
LEQGVLALPDGDRIQVFIAHTRSEHIQGLSDVQPGHFAPDQGMFFAYPSSGSRVFWMRNTHFDLDILFLDQNLKVIDVQRSLPHHPGTGQNSVPARTSPVHCRHVLEMRSDSALADKIQPGMHLQWISPQHPSQTRIP